MEAIRTPLERFENLKDYPFEAHYLEIPASDGSNLRMHYLDEGEGEVILCMFNRRETCRINRDRSFSVMSKAPATSGI